MAAPRTGRPREARMYKSESKEIIDILFLATKRVEAAGQSLEALTENAKREIEAAVTNACRKLDAEVVTLRKQVNKANQIIGKLLVEREDEKVDYASLRGMNHAYQEKK